MQSSIARSKTSNVISSTRPPKVCSSRVASRFDSRTTEFAKRPIPFYRMANERRYTSGSGVCVCHRAERPDEENFVVADQLNASSSS